MILSAETQAFSTTAFCRNGQTDDSLDYSQLYTHSPVHVFAAIVLFLGVDRLTRGSELIDRSHPEETRLPIRCRLRSNACIQVPKLLLLRKTEVN